MLEVSGLSKSFDGGRSWALADVSFDLEQGRSLAVLGPSGCGKSTLLRLIAGLETPDAGHVTVDGASLNGVPPHQRGFGLMHQDLALFPHLNVRDNIAFGLRSLRWSAPDTRSRADELLRLMRIDALADRSVDTLSGGEQQRVALARSLAPRPRLLMLDEPLGALDRHLRAELGREIRRIRDHEGVTLIYVTHDHDEAFAVADNILVLEQGRAVQHGAPEDVWLNPATPFVARFLGHANLFRCEVSTAEDEGMEASCTLGTWRVDATNAMANCTALIPPEAVSIGPSEAESMAATVVEVTLQGGSYDVLLEVAAEHLSARVPIGSAARPEVGATVSISIDWERARLLEWVE